MGIPRLPSTSALLLALTAAGASADVPDAHERHEPVGKVHFEVSCTPEAQEQFDYAMALLHSFFYPETVKAFGKVAELDPTCAMAYWGVAQAYRQNPLIAGAALETEAWAAVEKGLAAGTKTEREKGWLAAVEVLFHEHGKVPYGTRVEAYTRAMEGLAAAHPEDTEAQIYYALALNESADLTDTTLGNQRKAGEILERLWPRLPGHPGVAHYLIHTYDYPQLAERGLPAARAYAALAPASPHAKHMPSHVFSMAGMWEDVAKADEAARAAWVEYGAKAFGGAAPGELHSMDFLTYAYLQTARDRKAREMVDLRDGITKIAAKRLPTYTAYAAIPVRYALERDDWAAAAAIELPAIEPIATQFPQALAISHFGRALGAARSGRPDAADVDTARLEAIRRDLEAKGDRYWAQQVEVQEKAAKAWTAFARDRRDEALTLMREAADLEDGSKKHIAMENRLIPMRELLADMLLAAGQPQAALKEYEASLVNAPNRFRSYTGAAKAAAAANDPGKAKDYYGRLARLAASAEDERPALGDAKRVLRQG